MLDITEKNNFAYITLDRPEVRNAFNPELIQKITDAFNYVERQKLTGVVLQGEGKVFCAGADLVWMQEMVNYDVRTNEADSEKLFDMFQAIWNCTIPVIGVVQGAAYGGALGLLACCDHVLAEKETQFCFSEVKLGILPAVISGFVLDKVGVAKASPWMLSAAVFNSETAKQMGLVHHVYTGQVPLDKTLADYALCGPQAMRLTKRLLRSIKNDSEKRALTTQLIAKARVSDEGQEGIQSFLQKRKPNWVLGSDKA